MAQERQTDLIQGTLDLMILKALSLGPLHGYGVLLRIQQISGEELVIQQGSLYPALYRLEHQGAIASKWGESDNNRKAKYYSLTSAGRDRLAMETEKWNRMTEIMGTILGTTAEGQGAAVAPIGNKRAVWPLRWSAELGLRDLGVEEL